MVKVISLSEEAYSKLKEIKGDGSFSETVLGLVKGKKRRNVMDFLGIWKDNADEWKKIEKKIYGDRRKFKLRDVKW